VYKYHVHYFLGTIQLFRLYLNYLSIFESSRTANKLDKVLITMS